MLPPSLPPLFAKLRTLSPPPKSERGSDLRKVHVMYRGKHRSTLLTLFVLQNVVRPLVYDQTAVALWRLPEDELVLPDGPHAPPLGADAAAAVDGDVGAHAGLEPDAAPRGGDRAVGGGGGAVVASPSAAGGGGLIAQAPVHDKSTELNVFRNQMCRLLSHTCCPPPVSARGEGIGAGGADEEASRFFTVELRQRGFLLPSPVCPQFGTVPAR